MQNNGYRIVVLRASQDLAGNKQREGAATRESCDLKSLLLNLPEDPSPIPLNGASSRTSRDQYKYQNHIAIL